MFVSQILSLEMGIRSGPDKRHQFIKQKEGRQLSNPISKGPVESFGGQRSRLLPLLFRLRNVVARENSNFIRVIWSH